MSSSQQRWSGQRQLLQRRVHHRGLAPGDWHRKTGFERGAGLESGPASERPAGPNRHKLAT